MRKQVTPVRAASSANVHDHLAAMAQKLDLDLHLLEDLKATAALIAKIPGLVMMGERQTAQLLPVALRRKWKWTSRKTQTRMRWKR